MAGWYQEIGWNVERIPADGGRQVLLITNHVSEHYDAMYIGHMDTVFPDGTAEKRPFRIEGENYYGPGVGDMKNGDLAMFHIAANLPETEKKCLNIAMVYNPDERSVDLLKRDHRSNRMSGRSHFCHGICMEKMEPAIALREKVP